MSGQVAEGSTVEEQTRNVLSTIDNILLKQGTDKSRILELTIWLSNIEKDYNSMNTVYDQWITPGAPPCRACVEAKLYSPNCFVEVRVIAVV